MSIGLSSCTLPAPQDGGPDLLPAGPVRLPCLAQGVGRTNRIPALEMPMPATPTNACVGIMVNVYLTRLHLNCPPSTCRPPHLPSLQTLPPLLLGRAAQPGWLGALRDTVHVITGKRTRQLRQAAVIEQKSVAQLSSTALPLLPHHRHPAAAGGCGRRSCAPAASRHRGRAAAPAAPQQPRPSVLRRSGEEVQQPGCRVQCAAQVLCVRLLVHMFHADYVNQLHHGAPPFRHCSFWWIRSRSSAWLAWRQPSTVSRCLLSCWSPLLTTAFSRVSMPRA